MAETSLRLNLEAISKIMHHDFIRAEKQDTFAVVGKEYRAYEKETGRAPAVLIFKENKLVGALPNSALILRRSSEKISRHIHPIATISVTAHRRAVLRTFREHPHDKVAVVDEFGEVVGIIYSDDVLRLLQEHNASALFDFAGVQDEEKVDDPIFTKVGHRYKWLVINLGTAFLAAFVVSQFEETIARHVLLAVYMPIVAGMGGNAATQTLAVLVRGIALHEIDLKTYSKALWRELGSGLVNGFLNGIFVAGIVFFLHGDLLLALVLSCAMMTNLAVAAFFGTLVPLVMQRLGKDPAASATIFITTATDVLGFLAFLGLATWLLSS
ncbi:magnesium transporter [bacterium]|nr:magnesium transporter [bacterium]NBX50111.1 magnesium transporter [bacterium]